MDTYIAVHLDTMTAATGTSEREAFIALLAVRAFDPNDQVLVVGPLNYPHRDSETHWN